MEPKIERNHNIQELRRSGMKLGEISRMFNITSERVRQLTIDIIAEKTKVVKVKKKDMPLVDRLKSRAIDINGCLEWQGSRIPQGYGKINYHYKTTYVHRAMWEEVNGKIPEGLEVMHKCDNPSCINPEHLTLGTHKDNINDRESKGRGFLKSRKEIL